ncbi:hypothetical protein BSL78_29879 [Apostichopus japonicus]|uniref:Ig-like domain-containing protein n=1 Tax=Stichopus japonicus TaxID=307972 RepID=A0A2G8JC41_STIJA|nr:hypothetical protein BSL78_29879 [Apostichopus japonicus]
MTHVLSISIIFADFVAAVVSTNETVAVGNLVSLACVVGTIDQTVWAVKRNKSTLKTLSLSDQIFDNKNMELTIASISDSGSFSYNLIILNATLDMEGDYDCMERGVTKSRYYLVWKRTFQTTFSFSHVVKCFLIAVPPILTLKIDNGSHVINNGSINVRLNQEIAIECVAEGGRPLVSLGLEINGKPEVHGIAVNETFDAVISTLHYRPKESDTVISCTTSGQTAIPDIRRQTSLNIVYKPRCISQFINDFFTCHCTSNPAANVTILINGSHNVYSQTVTLNFQYPVNLSCLAINSIGKTTTEAELFLPNVNHSIPDVYDSTTDLPAKQLSSLYTIGIPICSVCVLIASFLVFTYTLLWRKATLNRKGGDYVRSPIANRLLNIAGNPRVASIHIPWQVNLSSMICGSSFKSSVEMSSLPMTEGSAYNPEYAAVPHSEYKLARQSSQNDEFRESDFKADAEVDNTEYHRIKSLAAADIDLISSNSPVSVKLRHNYQTLEDPSSYDPENAQLTFSPYPWQQDDQQVVASSCLSQNDPQFTNSSLLRSDYFYDKPPTEDEL